MAEGASGGQAPGNRQPGSAFFGRNGKGLAGMDKVTLKYALAAATILATVTIAVSAMAESGQYQPPSRPVDPDARLPVVVQIERTFNRNGATGLNNVKGANVAPVAQPVKPQTVQSQGEPVVLTAPPRRQKMIVPANPTMIKVEAPAFADASPNADGTPAPAAAILYAPPLRPPWWERLLSSRGFLYAAAFCLIVVPVAGFAASGFMSRRREERVLALYD